MAVTLFLVAMDSIFAVLPKDIYILVYADDILLLAVGNAHKAPGRKLQVATNAVGKWAEDRGFTISATKSVHTTICKIKHRSPSSTITINNNIIPFKRSIKVLGVTIDSSLNFSTHFNNVKQSCATRINLLKTISKPHRSNNRDIRLRVAKAIINSRLLYGLELTCLARDSLVKTLAPIYNNGIRTISGLLPSTPAASACAEIGVMPFDLVIDEAICSRTASFFEKTSGNETTYMSKMSDEILRTINGSKLPQIARLWWYGARKWDNTPLKIDSRIKNNFKAGDNTVMLRKTVLSLLNERYANHQIRYTDGSKMRYGVGFGVHSSDNGINTSSKISDICSVFSAEAAGIFVATSLPSNDPIVVVSDSAAVIEALQANRPRHPWIQAILQQSPPNTTLMWVPGHCGVAGNEIADQLAASGITGEFLTDDVPLDDAKLWLKTPSVPTGMTSGSNPRTSSFARLRKPLADLKTAHPLWSNGSCQDFEPGIVGHHTIWEADLFTPPATTATQETPWSTSYVCVRNSNLSESVMESQAILGIF